jgi:hypothetical protein
MRLTSGKNKRRFLFKVFAKDVPVKRMMRNARQIWPGGEERVRRVGLDMSGLTGTVEGLFWLHALESVGAGSTGSNHILFRVGGREYGLQTGEGVPVATYELGRVDFGADGPGANDLSVGDELVFSAVIPARGTEPVNLKPGTDWTEFEHTQSMLPGSKICWRDFANTRASEMSAGVRAVGAPSGKEYVPEKWKSYTVARRTAVDHSVEVKSVVAEDVGFSLFAKAKGDGKVTRLSAEFPAFKKDFRLKVTSVELG